MKNSQKLVKVAFFFIVTSISYTVSANFWFNIVPLEQILQNNPSIKYMQCFEKMPYEVAPFEIVPLMPNKFMFDELFILSIPNGRVQGENGHILIGDKYIQELFWADRPEFLYVIHPVDDDQVIKVSGRVAVIAQQCFPSYSHFLHEVLGRLALLEMNNVEYDWLYVPYEISLIKSFLDIWGIDSKKIISPKGDNFCLQADELIVPSLVISMRDLNTNVRFNHLGLNVHPKTMKYVKNKLIQAVNLNINPVQSFPEKVFVSRHDTNRRNILNEDEIFKLLEPLGFVSYELSKMTIEEQILLFQNAKVVVGEHGTGLTNIIFCSPDTLVVELFQALFDSSFWWISQHFELRYFPINTLNIDASWAANWRQTDWKMYEAFASKINIPLDNIYPVVELLKQSI